MEAGPEGQATPSHRDQNVTTLLKTVVEAKGNIEKEQEVINKMSSIRQGKYNQLRWQ